MAICIFLACSRNTYFWGTFGDEPMNRSHLLGAMVKRWMPQAAKIAPRNEQASITARSGEANASRVLMLTKRQMIGAVFNWSLCLLLMFLTLSQLLTIVLSSSSYPQKSSYGRHPSYGVEAISGFNDEPYSNRMLVCLRKKRRFNVASVNTALAKGSASLVGDSSGASRNGYRVVHRPNEILDTDTKTLYSNTCSMINATLEYMFSVCNTLGYRNLTRDNLRIVDDVDSSRLYQIANSLPVLIMPFWDNGPSSRYAIPSGDGRACMFRLGGQYEQADSDSAFLVAVNASVRESKTIEWLGRPDGVWKNGWYEDTERMRWYSDVMSTNPANRDGLQSRRFNMLEKREVDCENVSECPSPQTVNHWGSSLRLTASPIWINSVAISNGTRYGLFLYEAQTINTVTCTYDFPTFISDMSVFLLLSQWMLTMVAIQRGFTKGVARVDTWHNLDIGCLANSYTFESLPLTMLPRLKMIFAAFCSIGCNFEGEQKALSDSWFVIYPAIVDIVLIYSSTHNFLARILRRRMSSWQTPVAIMLLSTMHWFRALIGSSRLFGFDSRISTVVQHEEFEAMTLIDMLSQRTALRLTGNNKPLYFIKSTILFLTALPMLFSQKMSSKSGRSKAHASCASESSLCIRACNVGGVGRSGLYELLTGPLCMLNSYEVVRLGYIVVGNSYLVRWEDWILLAMLAPWRRVFIWRNHRILVFEVAKVSDQDSLLLFRISTHAHLVNMSDPKLRSIQWWDIDSRSLL